MIVWHGTNVSNITEFFKFSHFGTFNSAYIRSGIYSDKKYMYRCKIDKTNFVEIIDYGNEMNEFGHDLFNQNIISSNDLKLVNRKIFEKDYDMWKNNLFQILRDKGIFGFYYFNVAEGKGDVSYIVTDPADVVILEVFERSKAYDIYG